MEKRTPTIEALSLRRATVVDADKVRYRVYTTANDFVAVIAESALMAVRASGVKVPFKIMRDLPGENGLIPSQNMEKRDEVPAQVKVDLEAKEQVVQHFTELPPESDQEPVLFVPMGLAELQNKGMTRARILPAEMLHQIIEEHARNAAAAAAAAEMPPQTEEVAPHATEEEPEETAMEDFSALDLVRPPELSPAEKLAELADEALPPVTETIKDESPAHATLTPEEVQKLLNE